MRIAFSSIEAGLGATVSASRRLAYLRAARFNRGLGPAGCAHDRTGALSVDSFDHSPSALAGLGVRQ